MQSLGLTGFVDQPEISPVNTGLVTFDAVPRLSLNPVSNSSVSAGCGESLTDRVEHFIHGGFQPSECDTAEGFPLRGIRGGLVRIVET